MDQRYLDNNNGALTDSWTGLMWEESYAYAETGSYMNWREANDYIDRLNRDSLGGHSDWRLPSKLEIQSLYEHNRPFQSKGKTYVLHIDPMFEFGYGSCFWTNKTRLSAALGFEFDVGDMHWYPQASVSATARGVRLHMDPMKLLRFFPAQNP
ncbi:MAG: DUF1566 domain-containing protein [Nitrospinae bacterium]|nr:DUF1566 domain-containing protein [Nitrospinota bacterium]